MNFLYVTDREDFSYISDRRRAAGWARKREIRLVRSLNEPIHYAIFQITSDFRLSKKINTPFILDMVDMYLARKEPLLKDVIRGLARKDRFFRDIRFSKKLEYICQNANSVVVGSEEQAKLVRKLNQNVHVILDNHEEFGSPQVLRTGNPVKDKEFNLVWEGLSSTLSHLFDQADSIIHFIRQTNSKLYILSNPKRYRFMDKYLESDTRKSIKKVFAQCIQNIYFIEWTQENLLSISNKMDFAIIPINLEDSFAEGKPENKLMIFLRLGLPVLMSPTSAYSRVARELGIENSLVEENDWGKVLNSKVLSRFSDFPSSNIQEWLVSSHNAQILDMKWDRVFGLKE